MSTPITATVRSMKTSDKIIGLAVAVLGASVVAYVLYNVLPFLIEIAQNTIYFGVEVVILILMGMVVFDKNTWISLYYGWQSISRNIRRRIVGYDPIGILATVIRRLAKKLEEIDANITDLKAAILRLKKYIQNSSDKAREQYGMAEEAKRIGKSEIVVGQFALAAKRWEDSAMKQQPLMETLLDAQVCMSRAREVCEVKLLDTENQKLVYSQERDATTAGRNVVRRIKGFLGRNTELEMQEEATEALERDASESLAEIDQFIEIITPSLDSNDIAKAAERRQAMTKFNKFLAGKGMIQLDEPTPALAIPATLPVTDREKATVVKSTKGDK